MWEEACGIAAQQGKRSLCLHLRLTLLWVRRALSWETRDMGADSGERVAR